MLGPISLTEARQHLFSNSHEGKLGFPNMESCQLQRSRFSIGQVWRNLCIFWFFLSERQNALVGYSIDPKVHTRRLPNLQIGGATIYDQGAWSRAVDEPIPAADGASRIIDQVHRRLSSAEISVHYISGEHELAGDGNWFDLSRKFINTISRTTHCTRCADRTVKTRVLK